MGGARLDHTTSALTLSGGVLFAFGTSWDSRSSRMRGSGLTAYDASDVSKPALWKDGNYGTFAKFSPPMVANGKVYMATFSTPGKVNVYGLR